MKEIVQAWRRLRQRPSFALVAIFTLVLGLGSVISVFSIVDVTLIRPLPYSQQERLTEIARISPRYDHPVPASGPDFLDWRAENRSFSGMAAYSCGAFAVAGALEPEQVPGCTVSSSFLSVLRVAPSLGRSFRPDEESTGKNHVAIIGHRLWQRVFGGDTNFAGKNLVLDGELYSIIGVLPPEFRFEESPDSEIWTPLVLNLTDSRRHHWLHVIGRISSGSSLEQAQAELDIVSRRLQRAYPEENGGEGVIAIPFHSWITAGDGRQIALAFLAMVVLVLLIICANLAGLTLARGADRAREIATRAALGASKARLIRESLVESFVLSMLGGAGGIAFAWALNSILRNQSAFYLPRMDAVAIDARILVFSLGLSALTALFLGLQPAIMVSRADLNSVLRAGGRQINARGRWSLRGVMVASQVALAFVLLVAAGLLTRSMFQILGTNPGYRSDHLLTFWISIPQVRYSDDHAVKDLTETMLNRLSSIPGVASVAMTTSLPPAGWEHDESFVIEGRDSLDFKHAPVSIVDAISPNFFSTLGIPIIKGRGITEQDNHENGPKVVVVSATLASRYFRGAEAIGQLMRFEGDPNTAWTVVGVVGDTRFFGWDHDDGTFTYFPYRNLKARLRYAVAVRTFGDAEGAASAARQVVGSVDKELPLVEVATMQKRLDKAFAPHRFNTAVIAGFACIATVLAAIGVFGLVAFVVSQRTREFGLRMALGAERRDILRFVLAQILTLSMVGIASGLPCALAASRLMQAMLYHPNPLDIPAFIVAGVVLMATSLGAALIPAFRAAQIDPMQALRCD